MSHPRLRDVTILFLRVGNLTFGGGDPTMAVLQRELVSRRGWLKPETFGLLFSLARITPGTNLLAFCAAVGWRLLGWPGAVAVVLAVTLPSAMLVVWLTKAYETFQANAVVLSAVAGVLAAAVGMMVAAAWLLIRPFLASGTALRTLVIVLSAAILSFRFGVSPIPILAMAAVAGFFWREKVEP